MSKPSLNDLKRLITKVVLPFYGVKRDMTIATEGHRIENDAEHSWSLALLACSLAPEIDLTLDLAKICQYAVVHDLVEVYAGDTSVWDKAGLKTKEAREKAALRKLQSDTMKFPWIAKTATEYEHKSTAEAKFVWAVDKLLALLFRSFDEGRYFNDNKITRRYFESHLQGHRDKAHAHPTVGDYYDELRELLFNQPGFFYEEKKDE